MEGCGDRTIDREMRPRGGEKVCVYVCVRERWYERDVCVKERKRKQGISLQ